MLEGDSVTLKGISKSLLPKTRLSDPIYLQSAIHHSSRMVFTIQCGRGSLDFFTFLGGVHLSGDCYGLWGILRMRKSDYRVKQLEPRGHILIQVYAYIVLFFIALFEFFL